MFALWNRADHYIFILSFVILSSSFFFPRLISAAANWMSAILPHMVWPYCEFKMQIWNLMHAARWKYMTQKSRQKSHGYHRTTLSGYIFAIKSHIDNQKKIVKQQYVLHMSSQYGELRSTSDWDRSGSLRHPCKFQRVSRLGSVPARHWASAKLCGVEQRAPPMFGRATITLGIGPHSSFSYYATIVWWINIIKFKIQKNQKLGTRLPPSLSLPYINPWLSADGSIYCNTGIVKTLHNLKRFARTTWLHHTTKTAFPDDQAKLAG